MKPRRAEPEFLEQSALFTWARLPSVQAQLPGLDLLSSSLNGVRLTAAQAGKAKAAGMLKGEFDVKLPVARGGYHGLIIEMKAGKNDLTTEQLWYGTRMAQEGWLCAACWDWETAKDQITLYLQGGSISKPKEKRHEPV